jgi:hypothetical protein
MEHFHRLDIAARIRNLGLPPNHLTDVVFVTRFGKTELAGLRMPTTSDAMQMIIAALKSDQMP